MATHRAAPREYNSWMLDVIIMSPSTTLTVHQPPWRGRASRVDPSTWWEWDSWRWFCILLPLKHGFKQSLLGFNDVLNSRVARGCKRLQDNFLTSCPSSVEATNGPPTSTPASPHFPTLPGPRLVASPWKYFKASCRSLVSYSCFNRSW